MRKQALLALAAAVLLILWQFHEGAKAHVLFGDFRAFYCGAAAVLHGANPYAASSLHACESAQMPLGLYRVPPGLTVPAPLPGYALLALVPFALLPYPAACALWLLVVLGAVFAGVRALASLLNRPASAAAWALVPGFAIAVIPFGELAAIAIAALLHLALALRRKAWGTAAIAAAVAMVLPQLGLPAMLALFAFVPAMRVRIVAAALALAALDLAGSSGAAIAYVFTVLPAHARAEIPSSVQYGATWMLHAAHATDTTALAGGTASYVVMLALGIAASWAMCTRLRDLACFALLPPAFAAFGGSFVHYAQIMAAIPCALLLASRASGYRKLVFDAAVLLLVVPWLWVLSQPLLIPAFAAVCAACAITLLDWDPHHALRAALAGVVLSGGIVIAGVHFGAGSTTPFAPAHAMGGLAQDAWARYLRAQHAGSGPAWWIAKLPTWIGLLLLPLGCAAMLSTRTAAPRPPEEATAAIG